jgi:hypothetical protein
MSEVSRGAYAPAVRRATHLLFWITLLAAPNARAQAAGPSAEPGGAVPGCYVLTIYGLMPTCTLSPADQDVIASRAAAYLTDGARVNAVPTAGPAAAYFHNASQVLAAPTTSWVQTVSPDLGAGSFGNTSPVAAPARRPLAAAAKPLPAVLPPPAPTSSATAAAPPPAATLSASAAPSPETPAATTEPPLPTLSGAPLGPTTETVTSGAETPVALPQKMSFPSTRPTPTSDETEEPTATGFAESIAWGALGTTVGALLVFMAVRAIAVRARRL